MRTNIEPSAPSNAEYQRTRAAQDRQNAADARRVFGITAATTDEELDALAAKMQGPGWRSDIADHLRTLRATV